MEDLGRTYSLTKALGKAVQDGIDGFNQGLPFTINKLNAPVGGIMRGMYYLILGASKAGKSSFFYDQFIFNLADRVVSGELDADDIEVILYSLEIDRVMISAKAAVRYLFIHKNTLTGIKKLLGVYGKPPKDISNIMKDEGFIRYLEVIDKITTIFTSAKPMDMYDYIHKRCVQQSVQFGVDALGKPLYHFKNRKKMVIAAVDHMALIPELPSSTLKKTMDMVSKMIFVDLKRQFGLTPVVIQQVNPEKKGEGPKKLIYGHADARDTKNTFQDCDVCIAIGSPYHEEISSVRFKNSMYYIKPTEENNNLGLLDRFRLFGIEKDRYGGSAIRVAAAYVGENGIFRDIENPEDLNYEKYEFKKYNIV